MDQLEPTATAALLVTTLLLLSLLWSRRRNKATSPVQNDESLDTVQDWPPQVVRVMTLPERRAFEVLRRAVPRHHLVLAQVPLARFISVPTQNPYDLWMSRAGRLSVDLLVCDASSRAVAAVEVRPPGVSKRSSQRHERLTHVLEAAGISVHVWNEATLPSIADARRLFNHKAPDLVPALNEPAGGRNMLPVPEIQELLAEGDAHDFHQHNDPVPSGFFDDLNVGAVRATARA
jgi:Protein of unknown function (DUF2726)